MTAFQGNPEEIIRNAANETFENLVFEEVVFAEFLSSFPLEDPENFCALIEIIDPAIGEIGLLLPRPMMFRFAEATLGIPGEGLNLNDLKDTLGEMVNTLSGRIMAGFLPNRVFQLGLPKTGLGTFPPFTKKHRLARYNVGESFLILALPEEFWGAQH